MSHRGGLTTADRLEIMELMARINQAFDDMDIPTFIDCFEANGSLSGGRGQATGHDALAKWIAASALRPPHRHFTTNIVLDGAENPNHATARSHWLQLMEDSGGTLGVEGMGVYKDELVRTGDGWKVKARTAIRDR